MQGCDSTATRDHLLKSCDTFVFDCDGVIWHGDALIEGAQEAIEQLRAKDKRVLFVTNSNARNRAQLLAKLHRMGIAGGTVDDCVTGASAMALHLSTKAPHVKKCYLIGSEAVKEELESIGVTCIGGGIGADGRGEAQCAGEAMTEQKFAEVEIEEDGIQAVVVAGDFALTYAQICVASLHLQRHPEMPFLVGSLDAFDQLRDRRLPGPSRIAATAIEMTAGVQATITGKPSRSLAESIVAAHALNPERICMVGDRLDTDMIFGKQAGWKTLLVFSGCTSKEVLERKKDEANHNDQELWWPSMELPSIRNLVAIQK